MLCNGLVYQCLNARNSCRVLESEWSPLESKKAIEMVGLVVIEYVLLELIV
jgi:hypothetical protein